MRRWAIFFGALSVAMTTSLTLGSPVAMASTDASVSPFIVGGHKATIADVPWQVALISSGAPSDFQGQFCGGSLIGSDWVLTAAHCIGSGLVPSGLKIMLGRANLSTGSTSYAVGTQEIYVHPGYNSSTNDNDLALIRLASPVSIAANRIEPITLDTSVVASGTSALISGWGDVTGGSSYPTDLYEATVSVVSDASCNVPYTGDIIANHMLCAGTPSFSADTCQGDSGGPLAVYAGGMWQLAGVTSFGVGCAQAPYPGVYAEVAGFTSWINAKVPPLASAPTPSLAGGSGAKVGVTLTASPGTWTSGTSLFYKWESTDPTNGAVTTVASGSSASTYTPVAKDLGKTLTVTVIGSKAGSQSARRVSLASSTVAAGTLTSTPAPYIINASTASVGVALTVAPGTWTAGTSLSYQWKARSSTGVITNVGTNSRTYTPTTAVRGQKLYVVITATKSGYTTLTKTTATTRTLP